MRILIPDAQWATPDIERQAVGPDVTLDIHRTRDPQAIPDASWAAADGMVIYHEMRIGEAELQRAPNCRVVVRAGVGFDNIDLAACGARGIPVCNTPDYGTTDVADHAIAMMLELARGVGFYNEQLRADPVGDWRFGTPPTLRRLAGLAFGVVGLGRIGTAAALRARAFGMRVLFCDPCLPTGVELALGMARKDTLDELLGAADVVSLHAPLTPETDAMIDARAVAAMRPGCWLINTARGPICDPGALHDGLKSGRLAGVGLDVLPEEPPDPAWPLIAAWRASEPWIKGRLLLSPHGAFYSPQSFVDLRSKSVGAAVALLRTGRRRNCVNERYL